ncbi:FAD:protein FMN transferase [Sinimarinibacterium thermocellulolyticum]|uniref:FAD:protein FMN transferase n=1 Tax=Sinimarinibacterium thermocellulolyticum TaxID=3170016 RepID=A0ABV2ACN4_9GAMM
MAVLRVHRFKALGGPCTLYAYAGDDAALRAGEAEARRIEAKYSRYRDDSIVSRINAAAGMAAVEVDEETAALLDYAATAHAQSGGLFDITSGVLRRVWNFKTERVPTQAEIDALLPLIGWDQVEWQRPHIRLPRAGMQIDFGGFGKEYAADRIAALLRAAGVRHGLVDLAGDICVLGPHQDGSAWQVGVRHPRAAGAIATVPLRHGAIASSGDYERGFVHDGRRYSHILDPRSGWPVQGLAAVSVLADQCLIAGTAATCAMLLGDEQGPAWLAALGLPHLVVDAQMRVRGSVQSAP